MTPASRTARLCAQIIDTIIGGFPVAVAALIMAFLKLLGIPFMIAAGAWWVFYYLFADGMNGGRSFGKVLLGIRVVHSQTGAPCTWRQSFIRNVLLWVGGLIDWVFIFGERRQRLGDRAAETIVVLG